MGDDDDGDYWDTDYGSTFCMIIAPPGSPYFERLLECRVGPCNVLHLLQHAAAAPFGSVVRENIFKLVKKKKSWGCWQKRQVHQDLLIRFIG